MFADNEKWVSESENNYLYSSYKTIYHWTIISNKIKSVKVNYCTTKLLNWVFVLRCSLYYSSFNFDKERLVAVLRDREWDREREGE